MKILNNENKPAIYLNSISRKIDKYFCDNNEVYFYVDRSLLNVIKSIFTIPITVESRRIYNKFKIAYCCDYTITGYDFYICFENNVKFNRPFNKIMIENFRHFKWIKKISKKEFEKIDVPMLDTIFFMKEKLYE